MDVKKVKKAASPQVLGRYLARQAAKVPHQHGADGNVRKAEHLGHVIEIHTTYRVMIDGGHVDVPLHVDDDGVLHCHSIPNYQFPSAIDLVKVLVEVFSEDLAPRATARRKTSPKRQSHPHDQPSASRKKNSKVKKKSQ